MTSPILCPNCGTQQPRPNAKFCQTCGYSLSSVSTETTLDRNTRSTITYRWWALLAMLMLFILGASTIVWWRQKFYHNQPEGTVVVIIPISTPNVEQISNPTIAPTVTRLPTPNNAAMPTAGTISPQTVTTTVATRHIPELATETVSSQSTPVSTIIPPSSPKVQSVYQRTELQQGNLVIHKDIHFIDPDGDAYLVNYTVIQSDIKNYHVESDPITASSKNQRGGAIVTATWICGPHSYIITLQAHIIDAMGHQSDPFDLVFDCTQ